jgi:hypothetical protein
MRTAYLTGVFLFLSILLPAQETLEERAPRLLLCVENRADPSYGEAELRIAAKSAAFALTSAVKRIVIVEYGLRGFPDSPDGRTDVCRELRTDGWLWIGLSGEKTAPILQVSCFNLVSGVSVIEQEFRRDRILSLQDMAEDRWPEITGAVAESFDSIRSASTAAPESRGAKLTLRALPGTTITGFAGERFSVGEDGVVTASIAGPGVYSIRAALFGYYPVNLDVYIVADREIPVVQEPGSRWAFDVSFFNSLFPGANAAFFILPNWVFARLEVMTYLFGLRLGSEEALFSIPLFYFGLGFGAYLAPEDFIVRPYAAVGGFLRASWLPGFPPEIEPLSPGGIFMDLGAEFPVFHKGCLFIEYAPMLYLTGYPGFFMLSLGPEENRFGYLPTPLGIVSLMNMRFGFRWLL